MGFSWARAGAWAVAAVIGFVYGTAGTIGQAAEWGVLPLGLIVAVIGVGALLAAVRLLTADRWAALGCGLGAMAATLMFSGTGPGGSVVVPAPADGEISTGIIWTIAVPILTAVVIAWPNLARPAAPALHADAPEAPVPQAPEPQAPEPQAPVPQAPEDTTN
ncbi:MAG: histidinol dehydrogenase [Microbacterium sp.]